MTYPAFHVLNPGHTGWLAHHSFYKTHEPVLKPPDYVLRDQRHHPTQPVSLFLHVGSCDIEALYHQQKTPLVQYSKDRAQIHQAYNAAIVQHPVLLMHQNASPDKRNTGLHRNINLANQHFLNHLPHIPTSCIKMQILK